MSDNRARLVELVSPWPLGTCQERLSAAVDSPRSAMRRAVVGWVSETRLWAWKRINHRNSFQTQLTADMAGQDGRTTIVCRFGMHPFVTVFMAIWLAVVAFVALGSVAGGLWDYVNGGAVPGRDLWLGVAIPGVMLLFGMALMWFGRLIGQGDRQFLIDFVCTTLDAVPATARPVPADEAGA